MLHLKDLTDPKERFILEDCIGTGTFSRVFSAADNENNDRKVAIKIQDATSDNKRFIKTEYSILTNTTHLNLVQILGTFKKSNSVWFVMELCEGGPVSDLVNTLLSQNRHLVEEHIAYILKETTKALLYLHKKNIIHRDLKCDNILLTKEGEVKICDFGISTNIDNETSFECIGSPGWIAPEIATTPIKYDTRADVWSLGITAIELGDGKSPYQDIGPTRALFQITKNPPPTLQRPSNWSNMYNDFINECLIKNYEYRPFSIEINEHPFLQQIPDNNYHLAMEIKVILNDVQTIAKKRLRNNNMIIGHNIKEEMDKPLKKLLPEDFASIDEVNESVLLDELELRFKMGEFHTYIGDVLVILNPNEDRPIYTDEHHRKYQIKSRSDNAPHIFAVADTAYQNALHHKVPQKILLTGESGSGKTTNYFHLVNHLLHLGENKNISMDRIKLGIELIRCLTHAKTSYNQQSTRCFLKTTIVYGVNGKWTGANFVVNCLEKWRVSLNESSQGNFFMIYSIFNEISSLNLFENFKLKEDKSYNYLQCKDNCYNAILSVMEKLDFTSDEINTIQTTVSAIINLGEVTFQEDKEFNATIGDEEYIGNVSHLLNVDAKKLIWSLTNYCLLKNGNVVRRHKSPQESRETRNLLACTLYCRMVDFIINALNEKLAIGINIFGNSYSINIYDYFGFECIQENSLSQLFINCLNEQLQYHYYQKVFLWEEVDRYQEELHYEFPLYSGNKATLDQLFGKPDGMLATIDEISRKGLDGKYIIDCLYNYETSNIKVNSSNEFLITHYTGKVRYNVSNIPNKNRDYLPSEIIETLRLSENSIIRSLFNTKLNKTGNLLWNNDPNQNERHSQTKKFRTASTVFRVFSRDLLKDLSNGDSHFVRCIQTNLKQSPNQFQKELVKQQIRALAIVETAKTRQDGYSCRISFSEFLRRYQFLGFDFDENVEVSGENCRLLLVRLKIEEGWAVGKSKVFLKYYNEEYLARLYEIQVNKVIRIQSIIRGFLVKCRLSKQTKEKQFEQLENITNMLSKDEAAEIIQRAFRKSLHQHEEEEQKQNYKAPSLTKENLPIIKYFAKKWKSKSVFQVLMLYRNQKFQNFFYFAQQAHLYNLNTFHAMKEINEKVDLESVNPNAQLSLLGERNVQIMKMSFKLDSIPYYCSSTCTNVETQIVKEEPWDTAYRWKESIFPTVSSKLQEKNDNSLQSIFYSRNPNDQLKTTPDIQEKHTPAEIKTVTTDIKQKEVKIYIDPTVTSNEKHTTLANKDFHYIKGNNITKKNLVDPISELHDFAQKNKSNVENNSPPFNFKGMLRKTNFRRNSIGDALDAVHATQNGYENGENESSVCFKFNSGLVMSGVEIQV